MWTLAVDRNRRTAVHLPPPDTQAFETMSDSRSESPMRIKLSSDRRKTLLVSIRNYFADHFDEPISDFRADGLLDFFVKQLGPPVYNQGVRDASAFMQLKLSDLEGEVYEKESP